MIIGAGYKNPKRGAAMVYTADNPTSGTGLSSWICMVPSRRLWLPHYITHRLFHTVHCSSVHNMCGYGFESRGAYLYVLALHHHLSC